MAVFASTLATLAAVSGCEKRAATQQQAQPPVRKDLYKVRGEVMQLPSPEAPLAEFQVRHEAMPNFRNQDGSLGMNTMTMPFPPVKDLKLDGLKAGDKIMLSFEVNHDITTGNLIDYYATGFEKLPAETVLDFTPLAEKK